MLWNPTHSQKTRMSGVPVYPSTGPLLFNGGTADDFLTLLFLHCYEGVMESRGDGFERLDLGRSIDHSCKCSQHFRISIRVVRIGIGFVLPQTDRNRVQAARIR